MVFNHFFILSIRETVNGYALAEKMKSRATFGAKVVVWYLQGLFYYTKSNGTWKIPTCPLPLLVMRFASINQTCWHVSAANWGVRYCLFNGPSGTGLDSDPEVHFETKTQFFNIKRKEISFFRTDGCVAGSFLISSKSEADVSPHRKQEKLCLEKLLLVVFLTQGHLPVIALNVPCQGSPWQACLEL